MTAENAAGFVLAGGQSSRMGSDKALALFCGVPLIQVAIETFAEAGIPAFIAGSRSFLGAFAQEIPDTFADAGPLGGIHAALAASAAEWNLFLPVDMPLMPASLLACLLQRAMLTGAPVTTTKLNGCMEPFPVVLRRSVLPLIEQRLKAQRLKANQTACHQAWHTLPAELGDVLDAVPVESLVQCGQCRHRAGVPAFLWFQSANTPADLARLNRFFG